MSNLRVNDRRGAGDCGPAHAGESRAVLTALLDRSKPNCRRELTPWHGAGKRPGTGRKPGSPNGAPAGPAAFVITESGSDRPCKVGVATQLRAKLSAISGGNHRLLVLRHWEAVDPVRRPTCEVAMYSQLAKYRLKGDWYDVDVAAALSAVKAAEGVSL